MIGNGSVVTQVNRLTASYCHTHCSAPKITNHNTVTLHCINHKSKMTSAGSRLLSIRWWRYRKCVAVWHSYKSRICVALRYRRYVAAVSLGDFHMNVAFMSQCDIALRSQMGRSAMSHCDLFATYLRCRRWVAFRSQCDIHFCDIAAT